MATVQHPEVPEAHVVHRMHVVAGVRGDVQEVLRLGVQGVEHVLERLVARLVGLGLLSGEHGVEVCTELGNADVQEAVVCVGQSHQLVVVAHELQRSRHVLVGNPAAYSLSERCAGAFGRPNAPALAHPVKGILKDRLVGLVVATDLVEPVPAELLLEGRPLLFRDAAIEQATRGGINVEVDQSAVDIKRDVLRPEVGSLP